MRVGENGSGQIAHDLMHVDEYSPGALRIVQSGLDAWVDFGPLLGPVCADGWMASDEATFEGFGPRDVGRHRGECGIDVSRIESGVGGAEEADFCGGLVGGGE